MFVVDALLGQNDEEVQDTTVRDTDVGAADPSCKSMIYSDEDDPKSSSNDESCEVYMGSNDDGEESGENLVDKNNCKE